VTREDPTGGIAFCMVSAVHHSRYDGVEDEYPRPRCDRNEEDKKWIRIRETM
jgi:hypothetical protein